MSIMETDGRDVQNIDGTSICGPPTPSWKQFWLDKSGRRVIPKKCQISGCTNRATDGAHVWIKGYNGVPLKRMYILPTCNPCNNPSNTAWMPTLQSAIAVHISEKDADYDPQCH
uniref:Uncharacterized protein n=1 Tax=Clytia hemisphaerica TaxID=252671 RepID=A0A7M5XEY8_9CNID